MYDFVHRNRYLDGIKKFYVKRIMGVQDKIEYKKIMGCFDLDEGGFLDKNELIKGI